MNSEPREENKRAVAALAATVEDLYKLASGPDGFVALLAVKVENACLALQKLFGNGAGNHELEGQVGGIDVPTGRGAIIPRGNPAPDISAAVRVQLSQVPGLLYGAWQSLLEYVGQPEDPWMHLEEAAWRMADANLLLMLASDRSDLSRALVTVDRPTLPFVESRAWAEGK